MILNSIITPRSSPHARVTELLRYSRSLETNTIYLPLCKVGELGLLMINRCWPPLLINMQILILLS
jgi:hypothetical protein